MIDISVIIATHNRCESLKDVLDILLNQTLNGCFEYEVIVVDNNSNDKTKDLVEGHAKQNNSKARYLFEPKQGKSYALNLGIGQAKGEILAFTDDDVILPTNWLEQIHDSFKSKDVNIVSGKVVPLWPSGEPNWYSKKIKEPIADIDHGDQWKSVNYALGGNMACRKELFDCLLFSSQYRDEDAVFSRAIRRTQSIMYNPNLVVYHKIGEKNTKKQHFLRWYFICGTDNARIEYEQKVKFPRCRIRQFVSSVLSYIAHIFNRQERFYYKTRIAYFLGYFNQLLFRGKK